MGAARLGMGIAAGAALIAIPAYAVVNFQSGTAKDQKAIHLVSEGADDGIVFLESGSSSAIPGPGSSSTPYPGSGSSLPGGCVFMCGPSDSKIHFPGSGSSLPGNDPLGVPESSTWMMMMLGFFSIGAIRYRALRRSRKVESAQKQDQA